MPKYGMVIDLQKCAGCGACALACKTENNTPDSADDQTFNWADYSIEVKGRFPNARFTCRPVLCNHCSNAACVKACPVRPKAMHKHANGITAHSNERCIGCRRCQAACPYSEKDVKKTRAQYSVISFNKKAPHSAYQSKSEMIPGASTSGAEIAKKTGAVPPHRTDYDNADYKSVRRKAIVEKCVFCEHRVTKGKLPYCVDACPAGARIFGDLDDPGSEVSMLVKKYGGTVLKPEAKTAPNVYYIRSFKA